MPEKDEGELKRRVKKLLWYWRNRQVYTEDKGKLCSDAGALSANISKVINEAAKDFPLEMVTNLNTEEDPNLFCLDKRYWGDKKLIKEMNYRFFADPYKAAEWFVKWFGSAGESAKEAKTK